MPPPHDGISALIRKEETPELFLALSCEDTRRWLSTGQDEVSHRSRICGHLNPGFPSLWAVRNAYLLFKPPSLWCFVIMAQAH